MTDYTWIEHSKSPNCEALNRKQISDEKDAIRYRFLRRHLFYSNIELFEARVELKVIGKCPSHDDIDKAIDDLVVAHGIKEQS